MDIRDLRLAFYLLILFTILSPARGDGVGILGAGKWLYKPVCAHTCRYLLRNHHLPCHGPEPEHGNHKRHTSSGPDPACWLKDDAFLRTTALCIHDYCPSRTVSLSTIEQWWAGHLATGTLGDWSEEMKPVMSYQLALEKAMEDVESIGEDDIPYIEADGALHNTSRISEDLYIPTLNYQEGFQRGEFDHGINSIVLSITLVGLPIILSLFRFLPVYSRFSSRITAILDQPLWGSRHRVPVMGKMGLMPTRGQSVFILYIIIINVVLMCLPLHTLQPNSRMESHHMNRVQVIGDRAGVLAFALYISLFLFSSRNNILLWITDWSHGTFLLLHRWIGYACIFQTVMHSILLLHYFVEWQDHAAESQLEYWYWGIIATLATVLIYPFSLLPVRQKMYEVFLATHQLLSVLILVASFLHIWYLYEYAWGYEIWIYAAGGIWFLDRALRLLRVACSGVQTATVTCVDEGSDLLRIEVDGVVASGHVYLYFPTLTWRFWESHPFSVLSTFATKATTEQIRTSNVQNLDAQDEKNFYQQHGEEVGSSASDNRESDPPLAKATQPRAVILARPQSGLTKTLLERTRAAGGKLAIRVLIESSYHSNPGLRNLSHCSTLIGIAGGVGITAILPIARTFGGTHSRVYWGAKHGDVVQAVQPELEQLHSSVNVETTVGSRLAVKDILRDELLRNDDKGCVGVVVCGPGSMADDVRHVMGELVGSGKCSRSVVFIDEAFSW